MVDAAKRLAHADRPGQRRAGDIEHGLDLVEQIDRITDFPDELVHEGGDGRIAHALGFETTLVIVNLPVIMWWMGWNFWQAISFDIAAMAAIVVYTYYFTLAYDRIFPIDQPVAKEHAAF